MRLLRMLRTPLGLSAIVALAVVLLAAVFAPLLWGEAAEATDTTMLNAPPSGEHPVGTDALGRDLLLRTLVATRLTVGLALGATGIALVLGVVLGAAPLLLGRRLGRVVVAGVNIAVAFPGILVALFVSVILGVGETAAMWAIGIAGAPAFARFCQTLIAGIVERDFVAAARVAGQGRIRILVRHVLPNIAEPLIVNATIAAGSALLAFAGLSFLGLGVQPPAYDWGRLMMEGLSRIYLNPLAALAPGIAVVVAGLSFTFAGEALAKAYAVETLPGAVSGARERMRRLRERRAAVSATAPAVPATDGVLEVRDLRVSVPGAHGDITPVRGVSLSLSAGDAVGIVGESGSGKSLTALAIAQLLEEPMRVESTVLRFAGSDLAAPPASPSEATARRRLLGTSLAMVFQDPMTSFNPTMKMGTQLAEVSRFSGGMTWAQARRRAVERLGAVKIPEPERRTQQYPHEFSGGMRQRAMIAMGLMAAPALVIADEPTTALDVTVQKQVLDLLTAMRRENGVALLLISHDVAVVRQVTDRIVVMYAGRVVEEVASDRLAEARHPYTRALVAAVPDMATDRDAPLATIPGRAVDPADVPSGCPFAARCAFASDRCREQDPALEPVVGSADPGHRAACWHPVAPGGVRAVLAEAGDPAAGVPAGERSAG